MLCGYVLVRRTIEVMRLIAHRVQCVVYVMYVLLVAGLVRFEEYELHEVHARTLLEVHA